MRINWLAHHICTIKHQANVKTLTYLRECYSEICYHYLLQLALLEHNATFFHALMPTFICYYIVQLLTCTKCRSCSSYTSRCSNYATVAASRALSIVVAATIHSSMRFRVFLVKRTDEKKNQHIKITHKTYTHSYLSIMYIIRHAYIPSTSLI